MDRSDPIQPPTNRKAIWGWAIYDWANSAFATTVMAVFFPILFKQHWSQGIDVNLSTFRLGVGNAVASLLVAGLAPILGAVADQCGRRKGMLIGFAYLGVLMTAALALIPQSHWIVALIVYAVGVVGFSGANIFYDALLPHVAQPAAIDRVSSLGFALGYLVGGLLLALNVVMTTVPHLFGLADAAQAVKAAFFTVALWWGGFTLCTIAWVPPDQSTNTVSLAQAARRAMQKVAGTVRKMRRLKTAFIFLLAYWCYIDGVDTIVRMAVDYGISLGFDTQDLVKALLITQFVGFPSAIAFGRLGGIWGVKRSIYLALAIYMGVTLWGAFMTRPAEFYLLAAVIGLVQGGIQALSRSFYTRLVPSTQSAEFFGFYNMLGKFAAIIGPLLMGLTGLLVKRLMLPAHPTPDELQAIGQLATRSSILAVLLLFLAGAILLRMVDERKGREELHQFQQSNEAETK